MSTILQANPRAGFDTIREEISQAIERVLESGYYILGNEIDAFEREFAAAVGTADAVAVASGTDALVLALRAAGIQNGDVVATASHTAVATVAAIHLAGARALLLDVDDCYGLDPLQLEQVLAADAELRPKAVVPVHLYGQMIDPEVFSIAERYGIPVIEDCAQAHGAFHEDCQAGSCGLLSAFSFYPTKNLGAFGDAGAVVTNEPELAQQIRAWRQYGWRDERISLSTGMNSRMDEIQAAILRVKLERLVEDNQARRSIAEQYDDGLSACGVELPQRRFGARPVFHQYVIQTGQRDLLRRKLASVGITTAIHYPVPVHLQPGYVDHVRLAEGGLPQTDSLVGRILSLPMYPQLTDAQIARVIAAVNDAAIGLT